MILCSPFLCLAKFRLAFSGGHLISSRRCRCFGKALLLLQGPPNSFSKTNRGTARQSRSTTLNWSSNLLYLRCAALGFFYKCFSLLLRVELSTPAMELVTILALGLALLVDLEIFTSKMLLSGKCCPLSRPWMRVRNLKV